MMDIAISNTSEKPIYQQLFERISAQIIKGDIEKGYSTNGRAHDISVSYAFYVVTA
ncbi:MAG: GntR family transcriptional regulator [Clostridium sp.]|jgi:GntR family transcriptional regulator